MSSNISQIEIDLLHVQFTCLDFRKIEDVIDDSEERNALVMYFGEVVVSVSASGRFSGQGLKIR